jgi:hypothetical protein
MPGEKTSNHHQIGTWVGLRTDEDVMAKGKLLPLLGIKHQLFNSPILLLTYTFILLQQDILEGRKSAKPPHRLPESIQKELDKRSIGNR